MTIDNIIDDVICDELIKIIDEYLSIELKNKKNNNKVTFNKFFYDRGLADKTWNIIGDKIPDHFKQIKRNEKIYELYGFGEKITAAYYNYGNIRKHIDKFYSDDDKPAYYALFIYLNDNYEGGETCFYPLDCNKIMIKPKKGMGVVFDASLQHDCNLVLGEKYGINFKLVYSPK